MFIDFILTFRNEDLEIAELHLNFCSYYRLTSCSVYALSSSCEIRRKRMAVVFGAARWWTLQVCFQLFEVYVVSCFVVYNISDLCMRLCVEV